MPGATDDPTPDPLPALRDVIAAHGLSARKSLGQNFLLDFNLTRRIARAAGPLEDAAVYEVGPGPGGLTRALLAEGAKCVVAVERDERCLPALAEIAQAFPGRLKIIKGDALTPDECEILRTEGISGDVRIAANLPYNVASPLLVKWLTRPRIWQSLTLMFQREVAERLVAEPGSKDYGRLSVLAQWRARPRILFDVHPRAFTPPPKVTSSVVRIEPREDTAPEAERQAFEAVSKAAFGQRRKMLRQSLKALVPNAIALIEQAGVSPEDRAENLSIAQFAALARAYRTMIEATRKTCKGD